MIDGVLMAAFGVLFTLIGHGSIKFPMKPGVDEAAWRKRYGTLFKIGGPLLIVIGVLLCIAPLVAGDPPR